MLDTLGLRLTNELAIGVNLLIALVAFILSKPMAHAADPVAAPVGQLKGGRRAVAGKIPEVSRAHGLLFLTIAFMNGLAGITCEVLWFRYLAFVGQSAYVFPTILSVCLIGLGAGAFIYDLLAGRIQFSIRALAEVEVLLAVTVLATFVTSALVYAGGPPERLSLKGMTWLTILLPTLLMGMVFPLLCSIYGRHVEALGRRVGMLFAVNTAGTVFGSLLPIFVLIPLLGIQKSLLFASLLYGGMGLVVLMRCAGGSRGLMAGAAAVCAGVVVLFVFVVPSNLCQRVFLATHFSLARHSDILFCREGRTGTAMVTRDRVNHCKTLYVNGSSEVPVLYAHEICFKMLGDLGPMLHPHPENVLMVCFGGGIAAGATTCLPEVKSLTIVDLESSVVDAARLLADDNNRVLENPKTHVVIDDGRNYILNTRRKWPVIISDSTHPKTADSWVLYTEEFYCLVRDRLAEDGVFVEWLPKHGLRTAEFKIIVRTFQAVFPHASLWFTHGMDDQGQFVSYGVLVGTRQPLKIDVARLRDRLNVESVRQDLEPFGLHTPAGFLDGFLCAEDTLRNWVGDGPINTDDLPYTHYQTRYSKGMVVDPADFIEPMEDIWPYLTGTGSGAEGKPLHDELLLRAKANNLAFLGRLGEAYALLPGDVRYQRMRHLYEEGPHYVGALVKVYWDNPDALIYLMGLRAGGPGGLANMRRVFERVLELDPENPSALNHLASVRMSAGDLKGAEESLRRAVRRNPRSVNTLHNLGLVLERSGRHAEALQCWHDAALISENGMAADQWGTCLAQEGRVPEAIEWFRRAVELQPTYLPARLHLAFGLRQMGRTQEALTHVRYVVKVDPENKASRSFLADLGGGAEGGSQP
jgi:spermidine synthase